MKESKFSRIMKRIGCLLGKHWYKPEYMDFVRVDYEPGFGVYHVKGKCWYCKHEYNSLVKIPFPDAALLLKEVPHE